MCCQEGIWQIKAPRPVFNRKAQFEMSLAALGARNGTEKIRR